MKRSLLLLLCMTAVLSYGQHTISGTFSPSEEFNWLLAYKLEPGVQNYVADTRIVDGNFTLKLPENSALGTYRLVYAVPQDEYYFDVIYNGKEDISLDFSAASGVVFNASKENKLFNSYFQELQLREQDLIAFYGSGTADSARYNVLIQALLDIQEKYENSSKGLLVHQFISANAPYIPEAYETAETYINHKKEFYFKVLDIQNTSLQASGFLRDKLINYVFTALPAQPMDQADTAAAINTNIDQLAQQLEGVEHAFKILVFHEIWKTATSMGLHLNAEHLYHTQLKPLEAINPEIIREIEIHNRLRTGASAPEIIWKAGDTIKKLSTLAPAENYVLAFWSSTCSHCLSELPKLHSGINSSDLTKVVAIGLEDDELNWKNEAAKLPNFEHAISLGKWESEYANLYNIQQTPTYFILDRNKNIIAKPADYQAILEFLKKRDD